MGAAFVHADFARRYMYVKGKLRWCEERLEKITIEQAV